MRTLTKSVWFWILLLSIAWTLGGVLVSSDAVDGGRVGKDLTNRIQSIASDSGIDALAELSLPLIFLMTGLPFALVSLVMLWRKRGAKNTSSSLSEASRLRRQTILITLLSFLFALALWNLREIEAFIRGAPVEGVGFAIITYPVRLFVTFVHEAGHVLATLLTRGSVECFVVWPNGEGVALTRGGFRELILPAGYLGEALFGAALFLAANRIPRYTRPLAGILGVSIIALTLAYAMPSDAQFCEQALTRSNMPIPAQSGSATGMIIGIAVGVGMLVMGWNMSRLVNLFALNILAILTSLHALMDLTVLIRFGGENSRNDAAVYSQEVAPFFSPEVVAALWAICAGLLLLAAIYFGLIKQAGREISNAVTS